MMAAARGAAPCMSHERILAALHAPPGLAAPRRLERGAVLPHAHLDLESLGPDVLPLLAGLGPELPLRGLWLADNALGPDATPALARLLARHPALVQLDLSRNDLDLDALGPTLREHPGLRWLGLRGNPRVDPTPWRSTRLLGLSLSTTDDSALISALADTNLLRLDLDTPLPPAALALLCRNANRRRDRPHVLAALRRSLPEISPELPPGIAGADLDACLRVLDNLSREPALLRADHPRLAALRRAILEVPRGERRDDRRIARQQRDRRSEQRQADRKRTADAAIRRRIRGVATTPEPPQDPTIHTLHGSRPCYVCKQRFNELHFFYDRLCPACADESWTRRGEAIDLTGRYALVTGGRIKIGHQVALRLLAWGAHVIVTSRFARDTARRFAEHPEFSRFRDRLHIYSVDLRAIPRVELFAAHVAASYPRLDILVNNAAQTIHRPPAFYAALLADEARPREALPASLDALLPALPAPTSAALVPAESELFPQHSDDGFGQPRDLRDTNSWRLRLDEVGTVELLEVQLINAVAPFVLNARLRAAMAPGPAFIVNVSAPEGRFDRGYKAPYHPHTNMAKAALNMMTLTSAADYARDEIYMTSVDTGWASNENPAPIADAMQDSGFSPPLDLVDAAARVCDPIVRGLRDGEYLSGIFLKDFRPISW